MIITGTIRTQPDDRIVKLKLKINIQKQSDVRNE